ADEALLVAVPELLADAVDASAPIDGVERRHLAPVRRIRGRVGPRLGKVPCRAPLTVDDHDCGLVERARVKHAVEVCDMMRDAGALAVRGELQRVGDLLLVLRQPGELL